MGKTATTYLDYQQRAAEFRVGDAVTPLYASSEHAGRVVAVFPAIGMVDVEFPNGNRRYPVEELNRLRPSQSMLLPVTDSVPGGSGTVKVPNGPNKMLNVTSEPMPVVEVSEDEAEDVKERRKDKVKVLASRVAAAYAKKAVYWSGLDRKYRATGEELANQTYLCPKCKDVPLRKAVYKRIEGQSDRLFGCPQCLFLVKRDDLTNCHLNEVA